MSQSNGILPDKNPIGSTYLHYAQEVATSEPLSTRERQSGGDSRASKATGVVYQDNGAQDGVEISGHHKQALILFDDIPEAKVEKETDDKDEDSVVDDGQILK